MAVKAQYLLDQIRHTLGSTPSVLVDQYELIKEAVSWVWNERFWNWRERTAMLNVVAGQDWIALPSDFGALSDNDAIYPTDGVFGPLEIVSMSDINEFRSDQAISFFGTFYAALEFAALSATDPTPAYRLATWPTQLTAKTGAYRLSYFVAAPRIDRETQLIGVPPELDGIVARAVRAVANGYDREHDGFDLDMALAKIRTSTAWAAAVTADVERAPTVGAPLGRTGGRVRDPFYPYGGIGGP